MRSSLSAPQEVETPDLPAPTQAQDALRDAPDIAPGKADPPLPLPTPLPRPEQQFTAPVDVRSLSLALLALFASIAVLHWAAAVFIPVALSVLITSVLSPAVSGLQRWHVPRWLGAAVLLMALVGVLSATVWKLGDGASQVIESLPVAVKKVRDKLRDDAGKLYSPKADSEDSEGITFGPGELFTATDRYRNCLRLNFSGPWNPVSMQALARIGEITGEMLNEHRPNERRRA